MCRDEGNREVKGLQVQMDTSNLEKEKEESRGE